MVYVGKNKRKRLTNIQHGLNVKFAVCGCMNHVEVGNRGGSMGGAREGQAHPKILSLVLKVNDPFLLSKELKLVSELGWQKIAFQIWLL